LATRHANDKLIFYDNNEVDIQPHHWDGSPDYHGLHAPPEIAYKANTWLEKEMGIQIIANQ